MRRFALLPGARQTKQQRGLPFQLQRHAPEHLTHQRLIDKILAERLTLMGVVKRHRQRAAHQPVATERAVKARHAAHTQDLAHAFALFAKQPAERVEKLRLAAGVGAVAEFIFQTLKAHRVALAIRQKARHEETRKTAFRLRQHQMRVALRH
ncbi:hypothetical protein ES15_0498 [Cronobacter sakazakii ES15]|nr:hypothetical protein ES15_0498 [Cronobacter sakazakii ES15]